MRCRPALLGPAKITESLVYHEGMIKAKALVTLKALKLKISAAVLVILNMALITVQSQWFRVQFGLI